MYIIFISASHQIGFDTRNFYRWDFRERGGRSRVSGYVLLDYADHSLTGCNVSLVTQLVTH